MTTREDFEKAPTAAADRAVWWSIAAFTVCTAIGLAAAGIVGAATDGGATYMLIQPAAEQDSSFNWFFAILGVLTGVVSASIMFVGLTIAEQIRIHRIPPALPAAGSPDQVS